MEDDSIDMEDDSIDMEDSIDMGYLVTLYPTSPSACAFPSICPASLRASSFIFDASSTQGLTLVHFLAQRKHFLWDALGTFSR